MEEFRSASGKKRDPFEAVVSPLVDNTALQAADMPLFQHIVRDAPHYMEAIRRVREALEEHFGKEIAEIPSPQEGPAQRVIGGLPANAFLIAKAVVELLREPRKK